VRQILRKLPLLALAATILPSTAQAQDNEVDVLRAQVSQLTAQLEVLSARLDEIESEQDQPAADPVIAAPQAALAAATTPTAPATPPPVQIAWRGAPELTGEGGWSFKPRGRLQIDAGTVTTPDGITDLSTGFGSEVRRAYLGVEGRMPGGFGYRAEVDVASSSVEVTDLYLTYQASPSLSLMVGQTKPFWGLEEMTSDLFTSFTERAAINTAFGYERRLGANAVWSSGPVIVQAGVFTDNVADLNNDENNSLSFDGRAVFAPRLGDSQLHLAGSVHLRNLNDGGTSVRYRARPFIHTPDIRFIDTGAIAAMGENGYGLEAAWMSGPFHATGEWHWQEVEAAGTAIDPTFSGGYAEAGVFLTSGDSRGYRNGAFDRTRPAHALGSDGIGAIQINLRYDYIDLTDASFAGGSQDGYLASLVWIPTGYTRVILNYSHLEYSDAALAAGANRNYSVDAIGMRAQIDF
jgi:phosphate-selective porin OprO and OprP